MRKTVYSIGAGCAAVALLSGTSLRDTAHAQAPTTEFVAPTVYQAAGPNTDSIKWIVDQFREALGQPNGIAPGPLPSGRREINWDGGGSLNTAEAPTPFTGFLNSRGSLFTTPGSGFVQAPTSGLAARFANPSYETIFEPFSDFRLFSPIDSNVTDVDFFIPGSQGAIPALTSGFGAVFTDVDLPDGSGPAGKRGNRKSSTLINYYDADGKVLFTSFVPASPGNASLTFFGIAFADARIAKVRIFSGNVAPGPDDHWKQDVVMMDDFIFGEPQQR